MGRKLSNDKDGRTRTRYTGNEDRVLKTREGVTPGGRKYRASTLKTLGGKAKNTTIDPGQGERKTFHKATTMDKNVIKTSQKWGEAPKLVEKGPIKKTAKSKV